MRDRMGSYQSPLSAIIKGGIAGAAGTFAMGEAMARAPDLLERVGYQLPSAPPGPTAPDSPTEEVAERLAPGGLDEEEKAAAGQAVHWAYGSGWGAVYGVLQATFKLPTSLGGALFGAGLGLVADTIPPALRLQNPPDRNPPAINVYHMAGHVVYGLTVALVWRILNLGRRG